MKYRYLAIPVVALVLGILVLSTPSITPVSESEGLKYDGMVCVYKNNQLVECRHNIIVNNGKDLIETMASGAYLAVSNISVANCTGACVQAAADTTLSGQWTTCGLVEAIGTYVAQGIGMWNITYQWTSTCDTVNVNSTGLFNNTGANRMFAQTNFTNVVLQTNDRINVTWGLVVS
jgi:hypothetical protein